MRAITPKQRQVLELLVEYHRRKDYYPTVRELCAMMKLASTNTIQTHLRGLIKKGYLIREASQARAFALTPLALAEVTGETRRKTPSARRGQPLAIPVLGSVPAGPLFEAVENREGFLKLDDMMPVNERTFALRAQGDSMRDKGIFDGDMLVVQSQSEAESGDVVVALLDREATVKTYLRRTDGQTLQPANEAYPPIHIPPDYPEFTICGKVVGVIRRI